ncbi:hypothetical protein Tco_0445073 [Tanacetum coccineum]
MQVVQIILWYLDSGCSKHMTGNRSKLKNCVEKFIGIYNKRTRRIMETIHVPFDELHQTMAPVRISSGPEPQMMFEQHGSNLIRKGNLLLDLQKLQKNPIFRISVDICQNTNYVRAFTTSANVPSIYIQLFWNTLTHDAKTGVYSFQVNEHWLNLSVDLLRKALNVTPAD